MTKFYCDYCGKPALERNFAYVQFPVPDESVPTKPPELSTEVRFITLRGGKPADMCRKCMRKLFEEWLRQQR